MVIMKKFQVTERSHCKQTGSSLTDAVSVETKCRTAALIAATDEQYAGRNGPLEGLAQEGREHRVLLARGRDVPLAVAGPIPVRLRIGLGSISRSDSRAAALSRQPQRAATMAIHTGVFTSTPFRR
jgi:hypothetical protein